MSLRAAAAPDGGAEMEVPAHDPPLTPRDEAVFLLHTAAEIEHALLAQYLYAAYSLRTDGQPSAVQRARTTILNIAKEEMGHLISVQNLLHLIGGPINFERQDYPFRSDLYPFPFTLEPLTLAAPEPMTAGMTMEQSWENAGSLNKYIAAEMPILPASDPRFDKLQEIVGKLTDGNGFNVNRVGRIFERLLELFDDPANAASAEAVLADSDFRDDMGAFLARDEDWGMGTSTDPKVLVPVIRDRATARQALEQIAEQGEGSLAGDPSNDQSHFGKFFKVFEDLENLDPADYLHPLPVNPYVLALEPGETATEPNAITHGPSVLWAQLLDLRYRLLLAFLVHFVQLDDEVYSDNGDRTPRGWLHIWSFYEMSHVKELSELLVTLPRTGTPADGVAGPPFMLPYSMALPSQEPQRWRTHLDVVRACDDLLAEIEPLVAGLGDPQQGLLGRLKARNQKMRARLEGLVEGQNMPVPQGYEKVIEILDEALRGFPIPADGRHPQFWQVDSEAELLAAGPFGFPVMVPGNGDASELVSVLRSGFMPARRAPVDQRRWQYIKTWIDSLPPRGT